MSSFLLPFQEFSIDGLIRDDGGGDFQDGIFILHVPLPAY